MGSPGSPGRDSCGLSQRAFSGAAGRAVRRQPQFPQDASGGDESPPALPGRQGLRQTEGGINQVSGPMRSRGKGVSARAGIRGMHSHHIPQLPEGGCAARVHEDHQGAFGKGADTLPEAALGGGLTAGDSGPPMRVPRNGPEASAVSPTEALQRALQRKGYEVSLEHRFHPKRRWRFDIAVPARKLAIEIEGGLWSRGAHSRPTGIRRDIIKYNAASQLGWRVLRCTPDISGAEGWPAVLELALGMLPELPG